MNNQLERLILKEIRKIVNHQSGFKELTLEKISLIVDKLNQKFGFNLEVFKDGNPDAFHFWVSNSDNKKDFKRKCFSILASRQVTIPMIMEAIISCVNAIMEGENDS